MTEAFRQVSQMLGEVAVLVYNAGSGAWGTVEDITPDEFSANWKVNALGSLLASQQVIPNMKTSKSGSIIFIGATASRRGGAKAAAFATRKSGAEGAGGIHGETSLAIRDPCCHGHHRWSR